MMAARESPSRIASSATFAVSSLAVTRAMTTTTMVGIITMITMATMTAAIVVKAVVAAPLRPRRTQDVAIAVVYRDLADP